MWMLNDSGMGAVGWLVMVLVWVLLIALVVLLVIACSPVAARANSRLRSRSSPGTSSSGGWPAATSTWTPTSS